MQQHKADLLDWAANASCHHAAAIVQQPPQPTCHDLATHFIGPWRSPPWRFGPIKSKPWEHLLYHGLSATLTKPVGASPQTSIKHHTILRLTWSQSKQLKTREVLCTSK